MRFPSSAPCFRGRPVLLFSLPLAARLCFLLCLISNVAVSEELLTDIQRETRTDTVEQKLELLRQAYEAGRFDVALSLAESLKDTIQCDKLLRFDPGQPAFNIDEPIPVSELPSPWAAWAQGWQYVFPLQLTETAAMARRQEPVDLSFAFPDQLAIDLRREIRVARIERANGLLLEIPSQVYDVHRVGPKRYCRLVFFADAEPGSETDYLVFYGNALAELPQYKTDLQIRGDRYDLDVSNNHFVAQLSSQTGQLERLRYTRQHSLELFSGGKGHGEPPTIDWSNDYVDQNHYQKLRIRNWAEPPNYEVVQGPLMVRIRRWGFPHSPMHPVFTPSRMHIDQTYTFYAGKDYFLKEGTMEAVQDFEFTTMRDDEWVLSGYSFTDKLWIDGAGHLREGDVPADQAKSMRGVGFYHQASRDAFLALWLKHSAQGYDDLASAAPPTLHYHQHGQLWSRYPLGDGPQKFNRGTVISQKNAYSVAPFPEQDAAHHVENLQNRLLQPLAVAAGAIAPGTNPTATGRLARDGETPASGPLKTAIWDALREIRDEQLYRIDANLVDLGLVYDLRVHDGVAEILMTMPHRGRPVYQYFVTQGGGRNTEGIRERLLQIEGIEQVIVNFTWHPAWTPDLLTNAGRRSLGLPVGP
ncbi:MAG: metal-sulfur cluster assembly factor [Planctomycetales bacterium]|nr:metal-sulfur cluster assembly factor [Planctomycetales bacterium]